MTENYLTLTPGHKMRILTEHLQELESEHYLLGVMGEEALEASRPDAAERMAAKRTELDASMMIVRQRMDDLTGTAVDKDENEETV